MENPFKVCFKCNKSKPITEFYKHPMMADGRVNKCKECNKRDVRENRRDKKDYYQEYDRRRANIQKRKDARAAYAKTAKGIEALNKGKRAYLERHPLRRSAHVITGNAIRDGRLERKPCEVCGDMKSDAHHDDYAKPLDVRWLCRKHHAEHHKHEREINRKRSRA